MVERNDYSHATVPTFGRYTTTPGAGQIVIEFPITPQHGVRVLLSRDRAFDLFGLTAGELPKAEMIWNDKPYWTPTALQRVVDDSV